MAMRLLGTAHWVLGDQKKAENRWRSSQVAAEKLGAQYQLGLTIVERGRRMGSREDIDQGRSILASLGMQPELAEQAPLL
jgi:hypothetical protein